MPGARSLEDFKAMLGLPAGMKLTPDLQKQFESSLDDYRHAEGARQDELSAFKKQLGLPAGMQLTPELEKQFERSRALLKDPALKEAAAAKGAASPLEFNPADMDQLTKQVAGFMDEQRQQQDSRRQQDLAQAPTEAEQRDAKYGNDMAWLEDVFQQKGPTREQSLALGTTGDEHAAARQRGAADELFDLYEKGGLGAQERAARAKARSETEGLLRGQREADMQNLAERGMSGSGAEIASLLGSSQAAGERLSAADLQTSADAEQRALNALMGGTEIEAGLQKGADDYVQNNQKMLADIEAQNVQGRRQAYQQTMAQRNAYDMNKLGLQVGAAGSTASRDALENQAGWGMGKDVAKTDVGATNAGQAGYNANQTGTYAATGQRLDAAGNKILDETGDKLKAIGAGVDDAIKQGTGIISRGGA